MKKPRRAAQSRSLLDRRFAQSSTLNQEATPVRGWIRAIRTALGMTTAQLADRLGVKQPSVVEMEKSESKGSIELATLHRVAEALDCRLVYALVPNKSLETMVRDRAHAFMLRRRGPVEHSMLLEDQKVASGGIDVNLDDLIRETNPKLFWD